MIAAAEIIAVISMFKANIIDYHEMKLKESNPYITKAELLEAEPTFTVILIGDDKQYGPIPPSPHIFEVSQDDELLEGIITNRFAAAKKMGRELCSKITHLKLVGHG